MKKLFLLCHKRLKPYQNQLEFGFFIFYLLVSIP